MEQGLPPNTMANGNTKARAGPRRISSNGCFIHFTHGLLGLIGMDTDDRLADALVLAGPIGKVQAAYIKHRDQVNQRALKESPSTSKSY